MTRREAMRLTMQEDNLRRLGFTTAEARQLRRISLTLSHWAERRCSEDIEEREDGSAWITYHGPCVGGGRAYRIPNRCAGALRRLDAIFASRSLRLAYYHQTDPRGVALYVVPLARLRATGAEIDCCYASVGIAVC